MTYVRCHRPSYLIASVIVFVAGVISFANSYNGEFVFDDAEALINNKDVCTGTDAVSLSDVFLHDFWGSQLTSSTSHKSYRPLTVLTFRLSYWIAGGLYPTGFHIVNIFLHGIVSITFLFFISVVLGDGRSFSSDGRFLFPHPNTSLLAAVLFAIHPVHTESVATVVGRADLLSAFCYMLAFISYVSAVHSESLLKKALCYTGCTLLTLCSMLCKEPGITILGVCLAYDWLVIARVNPFVLLQQPHSVVKNHQRLGSLWKLFPRQICIATFGIILLALRWRLMGSTAPTFQVVDNPHSFVNGSIYRMLNYNYLYALNAWLLLNPTWLCFDWSMGCVPVITTYTDARLAVVILFWFAVAVLLWHTATCSGTAEQRRLLLSLVLIVVPFLPASNLFFRVGFVIAERNLYLPSTGFVMLVALGMKKLARQHFRVTACIVVLLVAVNMSRCIQRSAQWKTEKSLFESGIAVCPLNAKVHYNIAKIHADLGHVDYAVVEYKHAISLHPGYDQAMNNLGNIYKDRGQLMEAEQLLSQAVNVRPDFATAWMNLAIVQAARQQYATAEQSYKTALRHRHRYPDCFYNLGNLYLDQARHEEALAAWMNATALKPTHVSAWSNVIILLGNLGQYDALRSVLEESVRHNPNEPSFHFHYASSLGKAGQYEDSERHFLLALEKSQSDSTSVASYHANLGVLYHRWRKLDKAEQSYLTALRLDPNHTQTLDNLELLKRKLKHSS